MTRNGMGSHQSANNGSNTWITPKHILEALGEFDLDPATPDGPMPWKTAHHRYTETDDGLTQDWFGRVWLNPPYTTSLIQQFMAKMSQYGRGTALVFARVDTQWAHQHVFQSETASGVLFLEGRLHFHRQCGQRGRTNAGAPSMLVAYGMDDFEKLYNLESEGRILPLNNLSGLVWVQKDMSQSIPSWKELMLDVLKSLGGEADLQTVYKRVESHVKAKNNKNWRAKVRQILQRHTIRTSPAQYALEGV